MSNVAETAPTPLELSVPKEIGERILADVVRVLGLKPEHIVDGSLTMEWDHDGARVQWQGAASLSSEVAATLVMREWVGRG